MKRLSSKTKIAGVEDKALYWYWKKKNSRSLSIFYTHTCWQNLWVFSDLQTDFVLFFYMPAVHSCILPALWYENTFNLHYADNVLSYGSVRLNLGSSTRIVGGLKVVSYAFSFCSASTALSHLMLRGANLLLIEEGSKWQKFTQNQQFNTTVNRHYPLAFF